MSEGSMTGRPYGGANERSGDGPLPGERPLGDDERQVGAAPEQEPRAGQGGMSDSPGEAGGIPGNPGGPNPVERPNEG
jgi:hypothetical protein